MDALLHLTAVTSHHDVKGLWQLYDTIEADIRGLKALEVEVESYGSVMVSILMNKLPHEIRLIVSRSLKLEKWDFNDVMHIMEQEVDARERSFMSTQQIQQPRKQPPLHRTATALTTETATIKCAFCDQDHQSQSYSLVTDVKTRKDALQKSRRCYLCLRKGHLVIQCHSSSVCRKPVASTTLPYIPSQTQVILNHPTLLILRCQASSRIHILPEIPVQCKWMHRYQYSCKLQS